MIAHLGKIINNNERSKLFTLSQNRPKWLLDHVLYSYIHIKSNNTTMKKFNLVIIACVAIVFASCTGGSSNTETTTSDSAKMMRTDTSSKMSSTDTTSHMAAMVDEDTKKFAMGAATGGMMEVQLGNVAMKNSVTQSVKDFGKMMVDDHTKLNDQLKGLASKKMIDLPTAVTNDQQKEIDNLSKKTGADFDKAYVKMMIDDHKTDIADFKKNGDKLSDADFNTFIMNALPTLQKHLDAIQAIKAKM
jgi:putative membrane protein